MAIERSSLIRKVIAGGDKRHSRFHTEDNIFIGWRAAITETPIVIAQRLRNEIAGSRTAIPWWPLPAINAIETLISRTTRAIEFGSGSSSLWLAERVNWLLTREHDFQWAEVTRNRLAAHGLRNCDVQFRRGQSYYEIEEGEQFDLAIVDGAYRWKCLQALRHRMNPGGIIYLDNSDSDKDEEHYTEYGIDQPRQAQTIVRDIINSQGAAMQELHGMIQGELFAGSGTIITFR